MKGAGRSIQGVAQELDVSRNTVCKYLKSPEAMQPRPRLCAGRSWDPYAEYIDRRMAEGLDCRVLDQEVQTLGCQGSYSTVVQYVRPRRQRKQPEATMRFETEPGEQVQAACLAHLPSTEALISWSDTTRATHPVSAHCNCS